MCIELMRIVDNSKCSSLTEVQKHVLLSIADHTDNDGLCSGLASSFLAQRSNTSKSTIRRSLEALKRQNYISVFKVGGVTLIYRINKQKLIEE